MIIDRFNARTVMIKFLEDLNAISEFLLTDIMSYMYTYIHASEILELHN